jgi:hypothetical protein
LYNFKNIKKNSNILETLVVTLLYIYIEREREREREREIGGGRGNKREQALVQGPVP